MLLAVAASPARAQQAPTPDFAAVTTERAGAFLGRSADLRRLGDWDQLRAVGRARRTAHPDESLGWYAEAMGAYGNGDVEAALAAWDTAFRLGKNSDATHFFKNAQAVQRNYPGQKFQPGQFVDSDVTTERARLKNRAAELLLAKNYDAIEATASELQKSGQTDALGQPDLQSFFYGLARTDQNPQLLEQSVAAWRAARPDSILARLAAIELSTDAAWRARGDGFADSITPAMSEKMGEALERGAQIISELPAAANESPLMFVVVQRWGQIGGDGRPFLDAIYREGSARFPNYLPITQGRIINLMPQWFGTEGEITELLREHADKIGGPEGDVDYALSYMKAHYYRGEMEHDDARFWRGFEALRARYPDSIALRSAQLHFGEDQGKIDGNYARVKSALSEKDGHIVDETWFTKPTQRAYFGEYRMEMLAKESPL